MNKQKLTILISTLIIFLSSFIVFFELKSYTPLNKDETEIINNYDKITREMNELIEEKKNLETLAMMEEYEKMRKLEIENEFRIAKELDEQSEYYIKKYGIKKMFNLEKATVLGKSTINPNFIKSCEKSVGYSIESYNFVEFDFNDDGTKEIIVTNPSCNEVLCLIGILENRNNQCIKLHFSGPWVDSNPFIVLNHKANGYYDFIYISAGKHGGRGKTLFQYYAKNDKYD